MPSTTRRHEPQIGRSAVGTSPCGSMRPLKVDYRCLPEGLAIKPVSTAASRGFAVVTHLPRKLRLTIALTAPPSLVIVNALHHADLLAAVPKHSDSFLYYLDS